MTETRPKRPMTFREFLDALCLPRFTSKSGAKRYNDAVSRPLRLWVKAQPGDHNAEDLLAIVPDDLRPELRRQIGLYEAAILRASGRIAHALHRHCADDA